jgi:hypothetical protein
MRALALASATLAAGAATQPVVVHDPKGDVRAAPDLTRASLVRGADGRLRGTVTLADAWSAKTLLASAGGPPGSVCLRLWTAATPGQAPPDFLACITALDARRLRGTLLREREGDLPQKIADLAVTRPSDRTASLRFSQSTVGRPGSVRFAAEATRPGCARPTCVDTAPNAPAVATLRLRKG